MTILTYLIIFVVVVILASLKQINQYERGVLFTMGRYTGIINPGWRIVIPIFQIFKKVDMRVKAVDVPDQKAITKDNVPVTVNAVIYYKVAAAEKAVIEVERYAYAVSNYAQTTMRNIVGESSLDELLAERDRIADRIKEIVDKETDAWGIVVNNVELKDVFLPESMERMIARQAEAEREKRAVIINAEGELEASKNLAQAAEVLAKSQGALHLRTLHAINEMSADKSNTVVFVTPIEVLKALEGFNRKND